MARRALAVVAGLAASISVASLIFAEMVSTAPGHPPVVPVLFLVFLASLFTLLAVALIEADRDVERLSEVHETTPRWSLRAARRRLGERLARVAWHGLKLVARVARHGLKVVVQTARAGVARLRRELEPERRRTTLARLKQRWYAALVVMGMPPEGLDAAPSPPITPASAEATPTSGGVARLRAAALAARRRGEGVLATRRQRLARSRPPQAQGPPQTRPIRTFGSRASAVSAAFGRRPLGSDPKSSSPA